MVNKRSKATLLDRLLPTTIEHPLLMLEQRRRRWGWVKHDFTRFSQRAFSVLFVLTFGFWMYFAALDFAFRWRGSANNYLFFIFFISVAIDGLLDLACGFVTFNSISKDINNGRWDLLVITPLDRTGIIHAKYLIAHVRAWRIMAMVIILRMNVIALVVLNSCFIPSSPGGNPLIMQIIESLRNLPVSTIFTLLTILVFFTVYFVEPLWRMSATTALGLAVSSRVRNNLYGGLATLAAVVCVWVTQGLILLAIAWVSGQILNVLTWNSNSDSDTFFVILFISCCVTAIAIPVYYYFLKRGSLKFATRAAFLDK